MPEATAESSDVQWTQEQLTELAAKLELYGEQDLASDKLRDDLHSALLAVRFAAALTAQGECRQQAPFKPLYRIRKATGDMVWTCGHKPPHESPA